MIGRVWPCHVVKIAAGTGRDRVLFITSPEIRGSVSVAFNMQALLSAARPLAVARSVIAAAMTIFRCIEFPDILRKASAPMSVSSTVNSNITEITALRTWPRPNVSSLLKDRCQRVGGPIGPPRTRQRARWVTADSALLPGQYGLGRFGQGPSLTEILTARQFDAGGPNNLLGMLAAPYAPFEDRAAIYAYYPGLLELNQKVGQAIASGGQTDYADQYFRTTPRFETGDPALCMAQSEPLCWRGTDRSRYRRSIRFTCSSSLRPRSERLSFRDRDWIVEGARRRHFNIPSQIPAHRSFARGKPQRCAPQPRTELIQRHSA
jgi:hypothetical protein